MHSKDLVIMWSVLYPECNYFKLLEVVCHLAEFEMCGIQTARQSGTTLHGRVSSVSLYSQRSRSYPWLRKDGLAHPGALLRAAAVFCLGCL